MMKALFLLNGRQIDGEECWFSTNTLFFDPLTGEVWARILRNPQREWTAQPAPLTFLHPVEEFPKTCPGSLIGCSWIDTYSWKELPPLLLQRELAVLEQAVERLTRGESIWYNNNSQSSTVSKECLMQPSNEIINRLAQARYKLSKGELTNEELREALKDLRQHRMAAAETSAKSKAAKAPVDTAAILSKFLS
jgi:hypothetical protein